MLKRGPGTPSPFDGSFSQAPGEASRGGPDSAKISPMMAQYHAIKAANPGSLLFYRMGDFYELFFEDAEIAARALSIVLTKRGKHEGMDIPMCGVPVERAEDYLNRLIGQGHRVAVCEQIEDPAEARKRGGKSVVRREVVRLVTPGTITEELLLDPVRANSLLAIAGGGPLDNSFGLACVDISTGSFIIATTSEASLEAEIARFEPAEIVAPEALLAVPCLARLARETKLPITPLGREAGDRQVIATGGRNPGTPGWGANGYGSISWNLSNVNTACPGMPVMTTETGYQTDLTLSQSIPEDVAARYVPRIFLEQWLRGIQRTYLYELIDLPPGGSPADSAFGLLHSDFSSKPAYLALMNLLHLLADPGPSFTTKPFGFVLTGDLSAVHHVLFEKRNGTFYLAIWVEQPAYDVDQKQAIPVPVQPVVLQTEHEVNLVSHSFNEAGAMQTAHLGVSSTYALVVSDSVTVLEIDQPLSATMHNPTRNVRENSKK